MNNSNKLKEDIKKHNGTAWAKAWLEESEYKHIQDILNITSKQIAENMIKAMNYSNPNKDCTHKETIKKYLLTSHYYICKACGEEV